MRLKRPVELRTPPPVNNPVFSSRPPVQLITLVLSTHNMQQTCSNSDPRWRVSLSVKFLFSWESCFIVFQWDAQILLHSHVEPTNETPAQVFHTFRPRHSFSGHAGKARVREGAATSNHSTRCSHRSFLSLTWSKLFHLHRVVSFFYCYLRNLETCITGSVCGFLFLLSFSGSRLSLP